MGERTWCYSTYAFLHYQSRRPVGVRIGSDTGVYLGTLFDLGPDGELDVGNFVTLVGAIICTNARVVIEDFAFVAHEVLIADEPVARPWGRAMSREPLPEGPIETSIVLGENCWIGARAVLLRGARIGQGSIVGAAAVVDFEVPPFSIVAGNPARIVGSSR